MEQTITLSEFLHKNRTKIHRPGMYVWYMQCCVGNAIQAVVFCFRNMEVTVRTQTVAQGCGRRFLSHVNLGSCAERPLLGTRAIVQFSAYRRLLANAMAAIKVVFVGAPVWWVKFSHNKPCVLSDCELITALCGLKRLKVALWAGYNKLLCCMLQVLHACCRWGCSLIVRWVNVVRLLAYSKAASSYFIFYYVNILLVFGCLWWQTGGTYEKFKRFFCVCEGNPVVFLLHKGRNACHHAVNRCATKSR